MLACIVLCGLMSSANLVSLPDIDCRASSLTRCETRCTDDAMSELGNALEPLSGRRFFLEYPCDLKPDDRVLFLLSLHGAGTTGNWQRHYFPATELKERYRLVIATPTAATVRQIPPIPVAFRVWDAEADDRYLEAIVKYVFDRFGRDRIRSFWIAGHSQGGVTAHRIACSGYFKNKTDGVLSLSGGRIGAVVPSRLFLTPPPRSSERAPVFGDAIVPACNLSYIFVTGEREVVSLPDRSPWAEKYRCARRVERDRIVDTDAAYVSTEPTEVQVPASHATDIYVYPNCARAKLVADVFRHDRDHADGFGPTVTEAIVRLMLTAPGGKVRDRR